MSSTLPFSKTTEAPSFSNLCLNENLRSPPKLTEAIGAFCSSPTSSIVDRVFKTTFTRGLSYGPSKGLSKNDRIKETQGAYG